MINFSTDRRAKRSGTERIFIFLNGVGLFMWARMVNFAENLEKQAELRQGIDKLLKCLKRDYPKSKIGWVTPWNVEYNGFPAVLNIVNEVCRQNGVAVLDAALTSGINPNDSAFRARYFQSSADNAHLNATGHELILDRGRQFLVNLCYE